MITKLYAMGLKGLDFSEEALTARTVFTGSVGAGKSARGQSLWLLATGTVPGMKNGKTASEILDGLGDGGTLSVGADIDGQTFDRVFTRTKAGGVTQNLFMNGKKVPKGAFDAAMLHAMQLCDVAAFLAASDMKQIEAVLALIPGDEAGRIRELDQQEAKLKIDLGNANHTLKGLEASVASMVGSRAELSTPSASLPEIKAEIARLEGELSEIDQQIGEERARIEAERKAAETAKPRPYKTELKDNVIYEPTYRDALEFMLAAPEQPETVEPVAAPKIVRPGSGCDLEDLKPGDTFQFAPTPHHVTAPTTRPQAEGWHPQGFVKVADLKVVLEVMDRAGCPACAAKMVLKKLIREAS